MDALIGILLVIGLASAVLLAGAGLLNLVERVRAVLFAVHEDWSSEGNATPQR